MYKVAVLGKGKLACEIVNYFHEAPNWDLKCVVPVLPEPDWAPSIIKAAPYYCKILDHHKEVPKVDLVVSCQYERIIKKKFLDRQGLCINIHFAPLPAYKGCRPINWALKNHELSHGTTIHRITEGIDDGPIYTQNMFSIHPIMDEVIDVYNRCNKYGKILFEDTIEKLFNIWPVPQVDYLDNWMPGSYYTIEDAKKLGDRSNWTRATSK